ncbi:MAG: hypothetical protein FJW20_18145 [Acidimicrobiia bacterium]|nr:hypothetical protein [Acidimicrobiia bacterium]
MVRVLDGIAAPLGGSRKNISSARNEINTIAEIKSNYNCLPVVDAFRTSAACMPAGLRALFHEMEGTFVAVSPVLPGCAPPRLDVRRSARQHLRGN